MTDDPNGMTAKELLEEMAYFEAKADDGTLTGIDVDRYDLLYGKLAKLQFSVRNINNNKRYRDR